MIVLDTDILTILNRGEGRDFESLVPRLSLASIGTIHVSIVTVEEHCRGWMNSISRAKSMEHVIQAYARLHDMLNRFQSWRILDFNEAAAIQFQSLSKLKLRLGTMDLRIAAIAMANKARLISRNLVDFQKVPGLDVEDWTRLAP